MRIVAALPWNKNFMPLLLIASLSLIGSSARAASTPGLTQLTINSVELKAPAGGGAAQFQVNIDPKAFSASSAGMGSFCSSSDPSKECICRFRWNQVYTDSTVTRKAQTAVTLVQAGVVVCSPPEPFASEINNSTQILISVLPPAGAVTKFATNEVIFTKTTSDAGSADAILNGLGFDDISHFSCYRQYRHGSLKSGVIVEKNGLHKPLSNRFCAVLGMGANSGDHANYCQNAAPSDIGESARAYYFNFFIQKRLGANVGGSNDVFSCPKLGNPAQVFPLDTTFALARTASSDVSIPVEAFTSPSNSGTNPTFEGTCSTTPAKSTSNNSIASGCLGFAAKLQDKKCPLLKRQNGTVVPTYRLRRYISLMPQVYDSNGDVINESQPRDFIYVLDRPVIRAGESPAISSILGPKPCPYSWRDASNVLGQGAGTYVPTYSTRWRNVNVDNIQFPNFDNLNSVIGSSPDSCAATLTAYDPDLNFISMFTLSNSAGSGKKTSLYVRPTTEWAPHYEEDISFEACAPLSSTFVSPPVYVAATGPDNVSYCAKWYPFVNDASVTRPTVNAPGIPTDQNDVFAAMRPDSRAGSKLNSAPGDYKCTYGFDPTGARKRAGKTPTGGCCALSSGSTPVDGFFSGCGAPTETGQ